MIRKAKQSDLNAICNLAIKLWPNETFDEMYVDFTNSMNAENEVIFVYEYKNVEAFCTVSLRNDYVEGCTASPTGYLEGIYVNAEYRNKGVGKKLVDAAVEWSKSKGCIEFGSDAELSNISSQKFHDAIGMTEANKVVSYIKKIL